MPPKTVATKSKSGNKGNQPTAKEKQYQDEIVKLNREIRILRSNLDPKKIEEELKKGVQVSEWNLTNELQKQIRELEYILKQYETISSISRDGMKKQQEDAQRLAKDTAETRASNSEVPDEQLQKKFDALRKEFEDKLEVKDDKISKLEIELKKLETKERDIAGNRSSKSEVSGEDFQKKYEELAKRFKEKEDQIPSKLEVPGEDLQKKYDELEKRFEKKEDQMNMIVEQNGKIKNLNTEIEEKVSQMSTLKSSEEKMKKELKHLKSSIEKHDSTIIEKTDLIGTIQHELDEEKQNYKKLEKGFKDVQKELNEKEEDIKIKDKLIETLQSSTEAGESANEKVQKAKISELEQKLEKLKSHSEELKRDKQTLENHNEDLKKEKQTYEKDNKKLSLEKETLEKSNKENMKKLSDLENKMKHIVEKHKEDIKSRESTISQLQKEKAANEKTRGASSNTDMRGLRDKHEQTVKELNDAKEEISELKNRLSKVVGANIMDNNPNITDLSDENRPTKLSEKFSELYDNEWTDAYEEVENELQNEQEVIKHLYHKLLDISNFCQTTSEDYAKSLKSCALSLPSTANGRPKSAKVGATSMRQLKELRKSFSPLLVENVFQHYIKSKELDLKKKPKTNKFIRECVRICWLMSSQDPPVIFDTANVKGAFDGDKFRTYTKTGKTVDYVVWPPMLLHQNGPVLSKGVAQGK